MADDRIYLPYRPPTDPWACHYSNVIVRVVVVHAGSGTNWITLAVAIAGLVLSLASLGWQAFAFRRSGHRVRVKLAVGILCGGNLGELIYEEYPSLQLMDDFVKRGFSRPNCHHPQRWAASGYRRDV